MITPLGRVSGDESLGAVIFLESFVAAYEIKWQISWLASKGGMLIKGKKKQFVECAGADKSKGSLFQHSGIALYLSSAMPSELVELKAFVSLTLINEVFVLLGFN